MHELKRLTLKGSFSVYVVVIPLVMARFNSCIDHADTFGTLGTRRICQKLFLCDLADGKLFECRSIDGRMTLIGNNSYTLFGSETTSFDCRGKTCNAIAYDDNICTIRGILQLPHRDGIIAHC